jgi:hypothetical protein
MRKVYPFGFGSELGRQDERISAAGIGQRNSHCNCSSDSSASVRAAAASAGTLQSPAPGQSLPAFPDEYVKNAALSQSPIHHGNATTKQTADWLILLRDPAKRACAWVPLNALAITKATSSCIVGNSSVINK